MKVSTWQRLGCQRGRLEVGVDLCACKSAPKFLLTKDLPEAIELSLQATRRRRPLVRQGFHLNLRCLRIIRVLGSRDFPDSFEDVSSFQSAQNSTVSNEKGPLGCQGGYVDEVQELELSPSSVLEQEKASLGFLGCSNCFSMVDSVKTWRCNYHRHSFRNSIATIVWEILDNPSTLAIMKIDRLSHFTKLLEAAARYEIELADVSPKNIEPETRRAVLTISACQGQTYHNLVVLSRELHGLLPTRNRVPSSSRNAQHLWSRERRRLPI